MSTIPHATLTEENFPVIYREHYALLVKYAFVIVRNKQLAQDTVSDLFYELWNSRDRLFIHTDIKNYLLVSIRRMANRQMEKTPFSFDAMSQQDATADDPHVRVVHKENNELLQQLLQELSPLRQEIIDLRLIGLTYKEIAMLLSITEKKVEYHLNTAICQLKETVRLRPAFAELSFLLLLSALTGEVTIW